MKKHAARSTKASTFEIDIAQEFKDVKKTFSEKLDRLDAKLDGFKEEISAWRSIFETKLTELNSNMKGVLERLTQHDYRFTEHDSRIKKLEDGNVKTETRRETISDVAKFGWIAAKIVLIVGALIGSVGGSAWILKLLGIC